jgi:hypothetical protein
VSYEVIPEMPRRAVRGLFMLLFAAAAGGCMTTNVEVPTTQFPVPLMQQIPVRMGLFLPEELVNYEFRQDLGDAGIFEIEIGPAQDAMFTNLLTGMFAKFVRASDPTTYDTLGADAVLVPRIAEMQFSTPQQTRTDYYEVWIRYDIQLYDQDGTVLAQWPLTAYGKANTQNYLLASTSPTLTQAALNACRDAMAFFTVQFQSVPGVQQWLQNTTPYQPPPTASTNQPGGSS